MPDALSGSLSRCPWCSAELPADLPGGDAATCPSCGATLASATGPEPDIRGVTTLDHEAILRARSEASRPRSRLLSFITGDASTPVTSDPAAAASLAPPGAAVRREMLRLEIEAQRAELEAESVALKTDVVVEQGIDLASLGDEAEDAPTADAQPNAAAAPNTAPDAPPPPPVDV